MLVGDDGSCWLVGLVSLCLLQVVFSRALTDQTPTCTPIILDGLAVKCVMWGRSVYVRARLTH